MEWTPDSWETEMELTPESLVEYFESVERDVETSREVYRKLTGLEFDKPSLG